jgi:hypothetical protein
VYQQPDEMQHMYQPDDFGFYAHPDRNLVFADDDVRLVASSNEIRRPAPALSVVLFRKDGLLILAALAVSCIGVSLHA